MELLVTVLIITLRVQRLTLLTLQVSKLLSQDLQSKLKVSFSPQLEAMSQLFSLSQRFFIDLLKNRFQLKITKFH